MFIFNSNIFFPIVENITYDVISDLINSIQFN